jgi:hypothetical protein
MVRRGRRSPWRRAAAGPLIALTIGLAAAPHAALTDAAGAQDAGLSAYRARYHVSYRGLGGGQIEVSLQPQADGTWVYESRAFPNMLGRLAISEAAHERGVMELVGGSVRPLSYDYDAGRRDQSKDIHVRFDWAAKRVTGSNEGKAFAFDLTPGTQDTASVQASMLLELAAGRSPQSFRLVTGGKIRDYRYWTEGPAQVTTTAGSYETVVWANQRDGSSRVSKVWHAPELGFVPVQAIQYRDGRAELQMKLVKLER